MIIRIIPMPYGDCIILQWDSVSGDKRTVMLDSGTQAAYCKYIRGLLSQLNYDIDLWVISHFHSDHIGGVLKYIDDLNGGIINTRCRRWMFNFIDIEGSSILCDQASIAESVKQGSKLSLFLNGLGFTSKDCAVASGMTYVLDDVKFTFLSPMHKHNLCDVIENDQASFAAASTTDYLQTIDSFNVDAFDEDVNAVNSGSISVLVEFAEKKLLWLSDSHPGDICSSLKELGYSKSNPLICDYMTLPHHGSKGNTSTELLELVRCERYIVTADGDNIYNLPNKETLVKTIKYNRSISESHIEFLFPSLSNTPCGIFAVDGKSVYEEYDFSIKTGVTVLTLD